MKITAKRTPFAIVATMPRHYAESERAMIAYTLHRRANWTGTIYPVDGHYKGETERAWLVSLPTDETAQNRALNALVWLAYSEGQETILFVDEYSTGTMIATDTPYRRDAATRPIGHWREVPPTAASRGDYTFINNHYYACS